MKKSLFIFTILLILGTAAASQLEEIDNWAQLQSEQLGAEETVNFLNGNRALGDINYGAEGVFNSSFSNHTSAAVLSSDKFVVAYKDYGNSYYGTAIVGTISGNIITYGTAYVFESDDTWDISITALSSSKFAITYRDINNDSYGTVVVGTVAGTVITFGSPQIFNNAYTEFNDIDAMDSNTIVIAYGEYDYSRFGAAVIGTISGTTVSFGSEFQFNYDITREISVSKFNTDKFVIAYQKFFPSLHGTAVIGTVSGTNISYGSATTFNPAQTYYISVAALDTDKIVVTYQDYNNGRNGTAVIGQNSGSYFIFYTEYVFNAAETKYTSAIKLTSTKFIVCFQDIGNSYYGTAMVGTVSGTAVSYGSEFPFKTAYADYCSASAFDATNFVVTYRNPGGSGGAAVIGTIETLLPPTAVTHSASNVTSNEATLNGIVNAGSSSTTVTFEYGTTTAYGNSLSADQSPLNGAADTIVTKDISGLAAGGTYHFRVKAVNSMGTTYGSDYVVVTLPNASSNVFPANGATNMPRIVTVNWRHNSGDVPLGFRVYQTGIQVGADIPWSGDVLYDQLLNQAAWGANVSWEVAAYNAQGECASPNTSSFTVMTQPVNLQEIPNEVVFFNEPNFSGANPPIMTFPQITLEGGSVIPTLDLRFDGGAVSNFEISAQVQDQPNNPLPNPSLCSAALRLNLPTGNLTRIDFDMNVATVPTMLLHWNGASWDDVTGSVNPSFLQGQIAFDWTSLSRGSEDFAVNVEDNPLPIELSGFFAVQTSNSLAELSWITQSESNMNGYNIFRSTEENSDTAMQMNADIISATNTTQTQTYSFSDSEVVTGSTYFYWLESVENDGSTAFHGPAVITMNPEDEEEQTPEIGMIAGIQSIYPNPFNPTTNISYFIAKDSNVTIEIYNTKGQLVYTMNEGEKEANKIFNVKWEGQTVGGKSAASGTYIFMLTAGDLLQTKKAILMK